MSGMIEDADLESAIWEFGPMFLSYEEPTSIFTIRNQAIQQGPLGISYTNGADTRWPGRACLGPAFNSISLSGVGGTTANTNSIATIKEAASSVWHIYAARGTQTGDIVASTLAVSTKSNPTALAERCTGLLVTKSADGHNELTEAMLATAYRVRTVIAGTPTADTVATNSGTQIAKIVGQASDRVAGFSGDVASGNILSGTTTMAAPAWSTVGTYYGGGTVPTGFAMNHNIWTWCTDHGPLFLNALLSRFAFTFPDMTPDLDNGRAVTTVPYIGTVVPSRVSVRAWDGQPSQTIGPERWPGNESPIKGVLMGQDYDERWGMWAYKNVFSGTTYFLAVRPRQQDDPHSNPVSYYCLGSTSNACEVVASLGTINGAQTQPIWMFGDSSNVTYFKAGLLDRWIDDSGYRFAANSTQSCFMTELRRYPDEDKRPVYMDFETVSTSSTKPIGVYFIITSEFGNTVTTPTITVDRPGRRRLQIPETFQAVGRRIQPVFTFLTDDTTTSPQIVGKVVMKYKREGAQP